MIVKWCIHTLAIVEFDAATWEAFRNAHTCDIYHVNSFALCDTAAWEAFHNAHTCDICHVHDIS